MKCTVCKTVFKPAVVDIFRKDRSPFRCNTEHGWVANRLTILEEVSKNKVVEYFTQNPGLIKKLKEYWRQEGKPEDLWERYLAAE